MASTIEFNNNEYMSVPVSILIPISIIMLPISFLLPQYVVQQNVQCIYCGQKSQPPVIEKEIFKDDMKMNELFEKFDTDKRHFYHNENIYCNNYSLISMFDIADAEIKPSSFYEYQDQFLDNLMGKCFDDIDEVVQYLKEGDRIICTCPFLQALATQSLIVCTLYPESPKHLYIRIDNYCNRVFDDDLESMMEQEEIPLYRIEHKKYIDDEGEFYTATIESHRDFAHNIDTFRLQGKFMSSAMIDYSKDEKQVSDTVSKTTDELKFISARMMISSTTTNAQTKPTL
ncbi:hypothetical protein I4U23_017023 [Adineta vaga]|nr:hypothetical protein I4U23_017023 [Adineta vaga]